MRGGTIKSQHRAVACISAGFTIVETMIVLGVTGLLFISVMVMLSGRQAQAQFNQAITVVKTQIEQNINEIQSGYYPSASFTCTDNGTSLVFNAIASPQGGNADCVFLGKALQFGTGVGGDPQKYAVYTLAGRRAATSFSTSAPAVVSATTETKELLFGLSVEWMRYAVSNVSTDTGAVALTTYFAQANSGVYGSQSLQARPIMNTTFATDQTSMQAAINSTLAATQVASDGVQICFRSGTTSQSGLITIGGNQSTSSVELAIKGTTDCS